MGGASLLENLILVGGEQGNFSVDAFVFICFVLSYKMNDRVNMLLSIQKFFPRKKIITN